MAELNPTPYAVEPETRCWVWRHDPTERYPRIYVSGKRRRAYHVYYERAKGPIPAGMVLDHLCKNTRCVNPDHLEAVTQVENMRRAKHVKLSLEIAEQIRRADGTPSELAERFGTSDRTVRSILKGEAWT
jgi:hypothetical protein